MKAILAMTVAVLLAGCAAKTEDLATGATKDASGE